MSNGVRVDVLKYIEAEKYLITMFIDNKDTAWVEFDKEQLRGLIKLLNDKSTKHEGTMKTPHKHEVQIKAWAEGERIEIYDPINECWDYVSNPRWSNDKEYRIELSEFKIGEWTAPKPHTEKLEEGDAYFTPSMMTDSFTEAWTWRNDSIDNRALLRGVVHLTPDAAYKHGRALAAFSENIENA